MIYVAGGVATGQPATDVRRGVDRRVHQERRNDASAAVAQQCKENTSRCRGWYRRADCCGVTEPTPRQDVPDRVGADCVEGGQNVPQTKERRSPSDRCCQSVGTQEHAEEDATEDRFLGKRRGERDSDANLIDGRATAAAQNALVREEPARPRCRRSSGDESSRCKRRPASDAESGASLGSTEAKIGPGHSRRGASKPADCSGEGEVGRHMCSRRQDAIDGDVVTCREKAHRGCGRSLPALHAGTFAAFERAM